jgi:hypothetical protein
MSLSDGEFRFSEPRGLGCTPSPCRRRPAPVPQLPLGLLIGRAGGLRALLLLWLLLLPLDGSVSIWRACARR